MSGSYRIEIDVQMITLINDKDKRNVLYGDFIWEVYRVCRDLADGFWLLVPVFVIIGTVHSIDGRSQVEALIVRGTWGLSPST